jgi:hypothetical protein
MGHFVESDLMLCLYVKKRRLKLLLGFGILAFIDFLRNSDKVHHIWKKDSQDTVFVGAPGEQFPRGS